MPTNTTNKLGHRIGARGGRTRGAILAATRALLDRKHLGEIRVADVAAHAQVQAQEGPGAAGGAALCAKR